MMAWAKRIYKLMIKVNKLFPFNPSQCFLKEIKKHVLCVSIELWKSLRKFGRTRKCCGNTRLWFMLPQHFLVSQTSTRVSILDRNTVKHSTSFLFLKWRVPESFVGALPCALLTVLARFLTLFPFPLPPTLFGRYIHGCLSVVFTRYLGGGLWCGYYGDLAAEEVTPLSLFIRHLLYNQRQYFN